MPQGTTARTEAWQEQLYSTFAHMQADDDGEAPVGRLRGGQVGDTSVYEIRGSAQTVRRTAAAVRAAPVDGWKVFAQVSGTSVIEQDDCQVTLRPGEFGVYDLARPYSISVSAFCGRVIVVPQNALALSSRTARAAAARPWPTTAGAGALLAGLLRGLFQVNAWDPADSGVRLGDAVVSLLAATLSSASPETEHDRDRFRPLVIEHVHRHLADPSLCADSVAAAVGLSRRTLDRLFEDDELSLTAYIRRFRLDAARRELGDPVHAHLSISAIAARWCFFDAAHFTRAFQQAYGTTPSTYRRHMPA